MRRLACSERGTSLQATVSGTLCGIESQSHCRSREGWCNLRNDPRGRLNFHWFPILAEYSFHIIDMEQGSNEKEQRVATEMATRTDAGTVD